MDITISTSELRAALTRAKNIVADKKGTMPILSSVLLEAQITPAGGRLTVRAYDLEVGLCSQHACEVKKEGAVAVPAKALSEIARALPEVTARLKAAANNRLELTSGAAVFKLAGLDAAEFPAMPAPEALAYEAVEREALKEGLDSVAFAMSSDETRYNLNGVFIEPTPCGVALAATDGHRLAVCKIDNDRRYGLHPDKGVIVPRKAVQELLKLLAEETTAPAELAFNENTLAYRRVGLTYTARLVDGTFPNYKQVIPGESQTLAVTNRGAFLEVLKRVLLVAGDSNSATTFNLDTERLTLSTKDVELGEASDSLPVKYTGAPIKLNINGRYVQDVLATMGNSEICLSVSEELAPIVVRDSTSDNRTYVLMPMRS